MVLQKTQKPSNATDKARQEMRQHQHEQRFRVVNCLRTTLDAPEDNANEQKSKEITIVDIEKHTTIDEKTVNATNTTSTNTAPINMLQQASTSSAAAAAAAALTMPSDSDTGYVYDLYLPDNDQQADYVDLMDDNYLRLVLHVDMFMFTNRFI